MNLSTFDFNEAPVRVMMRDEQPWFVAADVCRVLDIQNPTDAVKGLDDDETVTLANSEGNPRAGIPHSLRLVSESGLYALVFKSRKPEAKTFRKWVTAEVLPALRMSGRYEVPASVMPAEAGGEVRVSLLEFVRECCAGWALERQMEFGLLARRYCKSMGVVFQVEAVPGLGRVFTFPRCVLESVRGLQVKSRALPDPDAAEFERLLEAVHHDQGDTELEPEALRGMAKTMGLFPRIFTATASLESERSSFGRLAERFDGRIFPSGFCLTRVGHRLQRRYHLHQKRAELAMNA